MFYVVLKWKLKKVENKSVQFCGKSMRCPSNVYSPLPHAYQSFRAKSQLIKPIREGVLVDSTVLQVVQEQSPPKKEEVVTDHGVSFTMISSRGNIRFCDLDSSKKRSLEVCLNAPRDDLRDWKSLAHQLSFCKEEIEGFASGENPCRHLLQTWSKREGLEATVGLLITTLIKINRPDAAFILDPSCIRNQLTFPTDSRFFV
jgi:hypothetical protein